MTKNIETLDSKTFRDYYYLKEELVDFCRKNSLPTSGGKLELTERIALFLDTGKIPEREKAAGELAAGVTEARVAVEAKVAAVPEHISESSLIEANFVCSEKHRAFFKEHIGSSFSFPVAFQKWLKSNTGKTYQEAIDAYYQIIAEKKKRKSQKGEMPQIDKQFEYNTYIRDFFADNRGRSLADAIQCWKYKKQFPGHNRYERKDLVALEEK